jgi:hypothetical protein
MHGHGKSDSAIVAKKLANKIGRPTAEQVERRVEAEGNADQQSTRRAQDRISVSNALERIRHAARTRKKEQFTALLHHANIDMLRVPLYRQQAIIKRDAGVQIALSTLNDGVLRVGELLISIAAAMKREVLAETYIQADETPIGAQTHDKRGRNHQAYMW